MAAEEVEVGTNKLLLKKDKAKKFLVQVLEEVLILEMAD